APITLSALLPGAQPTVSGKRCEKNIGVWEEGQMTQLSLAISVFGLVLVGMLYARLRAVDRTLQLKRHRSTEEGLCDLLNYAALVGDGVVIGKNGALIAGWEYTGDDNASVTDTQRDVVSVRVNQALSRLGSGWMLHVDAVRT